MRNPDCAITGSGITSRKPGCTVSDPRVAGGEQTYRYVPNPSGYVDPLGLATCPILRQWALTNLEASRAARAASNFGKPLVQRNKTIGDKVRDMIAKRGEPL